MRTSYFLIFTTFYLLSCDSSQFASGTNENKNQADENQVITAEENETVDVNNDVTTDEGAIVSCKLTPNPSSVLKGQDVDFSLSISSIVNNATIDGNNVDPINLKITLPVIQTKSFEAQVTTTDNKITNCSALVTVVDATPVVKFGINFDDSAGPVDYNDSVLCFNAKFTINSVQGIIQATEDQANFQVKVTNRAACIHKLQIVRKNRFQGYIDTQTFNDISMGDKNITLTVNKGDFLETTLLENIANSSCTGAKVGPKNFAQNSQWAQILLDQCNTTGD